MGKSKKTLALVMALVMAFTIVPFGAWGVLNAAAEEPSAQAVTYYVPATELKDGQYYLIANADSTHVLQHVSYAEGPVEKPSKNKGAFTIARALSFDTSTQEKLPLESTVLWQYKMDSDKTGRFTMYDETAKGTTASGDSFACTGSVYLDIRNESASDKRDIISYYKNDNKLIITNHGDGYFSFQRSETDYYMTFDNGRFCHVSDSNSRVRLYEVRSELPDYIDFPITIRDLHADNMLIDLDSNQQYFNLNSNSTSETISNNGGKVNTSFLKLISDVKNSNGHDYRTGLTQDTLKDGELQYSPYMVIYVAHVLREHYSINWDDFRFDLNFEFDGSKLNEALRNKFTNKYGQEYHGTIPIGNRDAYSEKRPAQNKDDRLEPELFNGNITSFQNTLTNNPALKAKVDAFFESCDYGKYSTYNEALNAAKSAVPELSDNNAKILADYAYTLGHAKNLTYENVVNSNPTYGTDTMYYPVEWSTVVWVNDVKKWGTSTNSEPGASFMDVAWYMLHHFFEDTDVPATSLKGDYGTENSFEYFSKTVDDAATSIRLKRLMKEDGSVSYVYDSAFTSNWGDKNTPITNYGLEQNTYRGAPSASTDFFTPLDGKSDSFGTSHSNGHNYGFSLQGSGTFVYQKRENLFFEFNGDDDVFLYINGKRVDTVDLGGTHGPITGRVNLSDEKTRTYLGLEDGKIYDFDFFYMERNPVGANMKIETNIRLYDDRFVPQKNAYTQQDCDNSTRIPYGGGLKEGETIYYEFVVTNSPKTVSGDVPDLTNISFNDKNLGVTISGSDVTGIDESNYNKMSFYKETYNKTTGEWETEETRRNFEDKTDIQNVVGGLTLTEGQRFFICGIPHTLNKATDGTKYENVVYTTATIGGREPSTLSTSTTVDILDVYDKTIVVDFAGKLKVSGEDIFSNDELNPNVAISVQSGNASYDSKTSTLTFDMKSALSNAEEVVLTETYPALAYNDNMTGEAHTFQYSTTKTVKFVPANNVYYDDSFEGITYSDNWHSTNGAGGVITGISGTNEIYGNTTDDTAFTGDSHFITGDGTDKSVTASFDFKGDGVSVYMDTSASSGRIVSTIQKYKDADRTEKDGGAILDMYDVESSASYNGVPVINRTELKGYGYYRVEIKAYIPEDTTASLTGIRVYNPMNNNEDLGIYEQNAKFIEIRDNLKNASELTDVKINGALYIDNIDGQGTVVDNIDDYLTKGPKNEIYLGVGQAIAFKVVNTTPDSKVHVSARSLTGAPAQMNDNKDINSSLDMYYDITTTGHLYVIRNTGDSVLSLTNLKITNAKDDTRMVVSNEIAAQALAMFNAPVEPEVPEEPETPSKPQSPIQKFFEDVRNFFNKLFGKH